MVLLEAVGLECEVLRLTLRAFYGFVDVFASKGRHPLSSVVTRDNPRITQFYERLKAQHKQASDRRGLHTQAVDHRLQRAQIRAPL